jgi:hypothetical protein
VQMNAYIKERKLKLLGGSSRGPSPVAPAAEPISRTLPGSARERDTPSARLDAAEIDQLARNVLARDRAVPGGRAAGHCCAYLV